MIRPLVPGPSRRSRPAAAPRGRTVLLLLAAFLARLAYTWIAQGPSATPWSDSTEYDAVAWNLARGAGFSFNGAAGPYPTAFVPPLLPWLVSLLYRAVGHHYFAALVLQCAIGALAAPVAGALGGALFGPAVGALAGWLTAFHPLLVFFSAYLLTETTFTTMLMVSLLASLSWLKTPRPGRALGTGLLWGATILTRPTALPLPPLIAAWAWVPLGLTVQPRDRIRQVVLLFLGVTLVLAPWSMRNTAVLGRFVLVRTGGGKSFLDANHAELWNDPARRGGAGGVTTLEPYATMLRGRSEVEGDSVASAEAWKFLYAHRAEWPAMALAKVARFWRPFLEAGGTGTWQRRGSPLAAVFTALDPLLLWSILVLPFAVWGAARSLAGPRRWFQSIALAVIALFTLLAIPFWGSLRLRVPIEPLVVILAAHGFEDLRRRLGPRVRGFSVIRGRAV